MVIVLEARRQQRAICAADFYDRLLETIDRPDPDERAPRRREREAMRRRMAYAEVDVIVEMTGRRLARAEALAADVDHPGAPLIRRARSVLDGIGRSEAPSA